MEGAWQALLEGGHLEARVLLGFLRLHDDVVLEVGGEVPTCEGSELEVLLEDGWDRVHFYFGRFTLLRWLQVTFLHLYVFISCLYNWDLMGWLRLLLYLALCR